MNNKEKQFKERVKCNIAYCEDTTYEQIAEMASDMDYACTKRDLYPSDAKEIAKVLFLLGYRRLFKDGVMLSREELEEKYEPSETFMAVARELEDIKQNLIDKVVLSKEEYEELKHYENEMYRLQGVVDQLTNEGWDILDEKEEKIRQSERKRFYDKICTNTCVFTIPSNVNEDYKKGYIQAMADHSKRIDQVARQFDVEI